jgi:hypothetical protein
MRSVKIARGCDRPSNVFEATLSFLIVETIIVKKTVVYAD